MTSLRKTNKKKDSEAENSFPLKLSGFNQATSVNVQYVLMNKWDIFFVCFL